MSKNYSNVKMVRQPESLNVQLYPHQLASIYKMEKLEQNNKIEVDDNTFLVTKVGINSDIAGYGKTLSMIGLIIRDNMEWNLDYPYIFEDIINEGKGRMRKIIYEKFDKINSTLILVSNSILNQWCQELNKTNLKYKTISYNRDLDFDEILNNNYDVVLVTPSFYNGLISLYKNYAWKRFIFDEPGNVKVSNMKDLHAGFYWFVSATPKDILKLHKMTKSKENFIRDLFCNESIDYRFNIPRSETEFLDYIEKITIQNETEFVIQSFKMPESNKIYHKCYQPFYKLMDGIVDKNIISMIEADDIDGAISKLGGSKTTNLVEFIKENKQKELDEILLKLNEFKETFFPKTFIINITEIELERRKNILEKQIQDLDEKYTNMLNDNCFICYEKIKNPVLEINCQNILCSKCLLTWLEKNKNCPLCRKNIDISELIYITTNNDSMIDDNKSKYNKVKSKLETILDIIKCNPENKYLIFSDYDNTFHSLNEILTENNIKINQIKGNLKVIQKNIESFKNGDVNVLFLNSMYNGSGINLTEATDVIIYHKMSEDTEKQIIGRAKRIGREIPLNVHYLISETI